MKLVSRASSINLFPPSSPISVATISLSLSKTSLSLSRFCSAISVSASEGKPLLDNSRVRATEEHNSDGDSDELDWNTEDELEIGNNPLTSSSSLTIPNADVFLDHAEVSSSTSSSSSMLIKQFVGMGFSKKLVAKAIQENGEGSTDSILNTLLTYEALENSPEEQQPQPVNIDNCSSEYEGSFLDDLSDIDSCSATEEITNHSPDKEKLLSLTEIGYTVAEASIAIKRCGQDSSISELADFISAAQMAKASDADLPLEDERQKHLYGEHAKLKKRKLHEYDLWKKKKQRKPLNEDDETLRLPNPMIGFGVPNELCQTYSRTFPDTAIGPPFFYYENVALAPKGVWNTISRFLYEIEPEFVDSKFFCAAARKRGYVHNLPIQGRFPLLPLPPRSIHDALPLTQKWWPSWDTRTKLNCIKTCIGSARLTERIRKALEDRVGDPPLNVQKYVLEECWKWNLVWVGKNKVAPLECDEVEMLLGFPKNHTRGGGISRTDRFKSLGNSFQVDTVAYHLSVLKDMFPRGINLLSLFSGIGGAEVALHRLGIPLKNVVSVELLEVNRNIMSCWWEQTNQKGNLIHIADVQSLNGDQLELFIHTFGGFDLIVGGSPCNNLAGSNRRHRDGLEGEQSSLFYDYFRILDLVECIMSRGI